MNLSDIAKDRMETIRKVIALEQTGMSRRRACEMAGIHNATLNNWFRRISLNPHLSKLEALTPKQLPVTRKVLWAGSDALEVIGEIERIKRSILSISNKPLSINARKKLKAAIKKLVAAIPEDLQ